MHVLMNISMFIQLHYQRKCYLDAWLLGSFDVGHSVTHTALDEVRPTGAWKTSTLYANTCDPDNANLLGLGLDARAQPKPG